MNNIISLDNLIKAIAKISNQQYTQNSPNHSSIGEHVRHVIEYCDNFLSGIKNNLINYDNRPRNEILAKNQQIAIEKLQQLQNSMKQFANDDSKIKIAEAVNCKEKSPIVTSTIAREYVFIAAHIVHHLAIIKLIAEAMGITFDKDIGKAASTVIFEKKTDV